MASVRPAAVAGTFYPGSAPALSKMVAGFLAERTATNGAPPKAVIAPHAGFVYSGPVAASAFSTFSRWVRMRSTRFTGA